MTRQTQQNAAAQSSPKWSDKIRIYPSVFDVLTVISAANGLALFAYIVSVDATELFRLQFLATPIGVLLASLYWSLPHEVGGNRREALLLQVMIFLAINLLPLIIMVISGHLPVLLFFLAFATTTFENYTAVRRRRVRERLLTIFLFSQVVVLALFTYGYIMGLSYVTLFSSILLVRVLSFSVLSFLISSRHRPVYLSSLISPNRFIKFGVPRLAGTIATAIVANVAPQIAVFAAFTRFQTLFQMTFPTLIRLIPKAYHLGFSFILIPVAAFTFYIFQNIFLGHGGDAEILLVFALTVAILFLVEVANYLNYLKTQSFNWPKIFALSVTFLLAAVVIWQTDLRAEVFYLVSAIIHFFLYKDLTWRSIFKRFHR